MDNRVTGLDAGADDYLVKPFVMAEFEARARALVRRHRADRAQSIKIGPLELTMGQPRIMLSRPTPVDLTAREFTLLELLAQRAGRVVKKDQIASSLAPSGEALSDTAIEVAIHRLRRRLEPFDLKVQTIRGFGYLLEAKAEQESRCLNVRYWVIRPDATRPGRRAAAARSGRYPLLRAVRTHFANLAY